MKILHSISYYAPYISGVTLYCQRLAEKLARNGVDNTVICGQHEKQLNTQDALHKVNIIRVPVLIKLSRGMIMPSWFIYVYKQVKKHDYIFIHLPQIEGVITAFLAKIFSKKIIAIYHVELVLPKTLINRLLMYITHTCSRYVLGKSDLIISYTSDYSKATKLLPKYFSKVIAIYPPMILNTKPLQRTRLNTNGLVTIGYLGRISHEKGLEYLFKAMNIINVTNRYKLLIGGPQPAGEDKYFKVISNLVGSEKNVEYLGTLPPLRLLENGELEQNALVEFLNLIDIFVLPSINESFGIVQVEAMSFGCPVIAGDYPGMRVPIGISGMGVIIPLQNPEKLADAIIEITNNYEKYTQNQSKVISEFNIDKVIDQIMNNIQNIV